MALKRRIDKAAYDALNEGLKGEYRADPKNAGSYVLDVDGDDEDVGALKRARDAEKEAAKAAKKKAAELQEEIAAKQAELDELSGVKAKNDELSRQNKDMAKLQKRLDDMTARDAERTKRVLDRAGEDLRNKTARELSERLVGKDKANVIIPHIKARLGVGFDDGDEDGSSGAVHVLDGTGKQAKTSLVDLEQEFRTNADFRFMVIGSKASGGGSPQMTSTPQGGGSAPYSGSPQHSGTTTRFIDMNPADLRAQMDARVAAARASRQ